jgi:hypothetical protein
MTSGLLGTGTMRLGKAFIIMAITAACMAIAATACGGGGGSGDSAAGAVLRDAPARAAAAKSARVYAAIDVKGSDQGDVSAKGEGVFDFAANKGHLTLDDGHEKSEMIMDGATLYERKGANSKWTKSGGADGSPGGGSPSDQFSDPIKMLEFLKGSGGKVEKKGTETIRGTQTTHYRGTVDLVKAMKDSAGPDQADAADLLKLFFKDTEVPVDLWVDSEGRPARFAMEITFDLSAFAKLFSGDTGKKPDEMKMTMKITEEFWDWGTPVKIEVPAAKDVE